MNFFKLIPDESVDAQPMFTKRRIRKNGELDLLQNVCELLDKFRDEGSDMLACDMEDLVHALHRSAILVQKSKQKKLLNKLRKHSRSMAICSL
jgi:hypothetical protein